MVLTMQNQRKVNENLHIFTVSSNVFFVVGIFSFGIEYCYYVLNF